MSCTDSVTCLVALTGTLFIMAITTLLLGAAKCCEIVMAGLSRAWALAIILLPSGLRNIEKCVSLLLHTRSSIRIPARGLPRASSSANLNFGGN